MNASEYIIDQETKDNELYYQIVEDEKTNSI